MTRALWPIVALAAALRFYAIWFGLPYPHARPDESVAIGHAVAILEGDPNPHFFHWPSLIFYVFAALYAAAGTVRRALTEDGALTGVEYVVIARAFVALAGTLTVVALFRLGRRMADAATGLLAAGLLAVSLLHVRESHFAMTDVVMTLLAVVSLALLLRAVDGGQVRSFAAAGFCAGLAASTKYSAAALLAAMAAAHLAAGVGRDARAAAVRPWLGTGAFAAMFVAGFVVATPYAVLDYPTFAADVLYDVTHLSGGHAVDVGRGWSYHLLRSLPAGMGAWMFAAGLAGFVPLLRRHRLRGAIVAAFALALYASIGSGRTVFFRYVLPLVPVLCLTAAIAVRAVASALARRYGLSETRALVLVLLIVAVPSLVDSVRFVAVLGRTDTRVLAARWLAPKLQPEDSVYDAGGDYTRLDLGETGFRRWTFDPDTGSFGHPDGRTPDWLVIPESPLRAYGTPPQALRDIATARYELAWVERGTTGRGRFVYDEQDAFFLPMRGFGSVRRPGPTILIYRLVRRE